MAHPTILDADRVAKFTVSGSTDTFNITFPVFNRFGSDAEADLAVYVDGTLKPADEWTFSGDFTNGVADGGDVVFDDAITSGTVLIFGAMAARRTGDLTSGGIVTDDVNTEIDRLTAMIRELQYDLKRCIKIPLAEDDSDDTPVDQETPALASRKNLGLAFDSDGRPTAGTDTALSAWLLSVNALSLAADEFIYASGADTAAKATVTSVARTLIQQTTQALMRTTGLGMSSDGSDLVSAADYATMRTLLGLAIGSDVQAWDAALDDIAGLALTDGGIIVGDGSNFVLETGATARTSLGVVTATEGAEGLLEKATDAEIHAATAGAKAICAEDLTSATAAAGSLSDAATIAVDWAGFVYDDVTLTADRTLGNPTNEAPGTWRHILVAGNDGTPRTLSFGSEYQTNNIPTLDDITSTKKYLLSILCVAASKFIVFASDGSDP